MSSYVRRQAATHGRGQAGRAVAHLMPLDPERPEWGFPQRGVDKALCGAKPKAGWSGSADPDLVECESCAARAVAFEPGTVVQPFAVDNWSRRLSVEECPPAVITGHVPDHYNDYAYEVAFVGQPGSWMLRHGECFERVDKKAKAVDDSGLTGWLVGDADQEFSGEAELRLRAQLIDAAAEAEAVKGLSFEELLDRLG